MDIFAFPPLAFLLDLTYSALMALSDLLAPLAGGASAALAVIVVTLVVRALLIPVGVSQAKAEQTRARLAPRLRELQRRYRLQPERLQREMMQLYRDEKSSPFAGCLPVLAQAPVIGLLYAVFLHLEIAGHANALLTRTLFEVPLGTSLAGAVATGSAGPATFAVCGAIVALIAVVAEVTRRVFRVPAPVEGAPAPAMTALVGVLQYATAVVAVFVPVAAGLYLVVTVAWTLGQRWLLRRRYPLPA